MYGSSERQGYLLRPISPPGPVIVLNGGDTPLGWHFNSDLPRQDPRSVSPHALVHTRPNGVWVRDLGSGTGTCVNDQRVNGVVELRQGDLITVGATRFRFEYGLTDDKTYQYARVPPTTNFNNMANQHAHVLNQVGGDQLNQHLYQQRENFLREIAGTRSRAKWLIWTGLAVSIAGLGIVLNFIMSADANTDGSDLKVFFVGIAVTAVGQLAVYLGIILHVIATARRRRTDAAAEFRFLPPSPSS